MTDPLLVTKQEVLELLEINSRELARLENKGILPFCKIGGCKRYRWSDIEGLMGLLHIGATAPSRDHYHEVIIAQSQPYRALSGIYFLIDSSKARVVYVGQARNIPTRLISHFRAKKVKFDRYHFLAIDERHLDVTERFYIEKLRPEYNITYNSSGARSEETTVCAEQEQPPSDQGQFQADLRAAIKRLREISR